MKKSTPSQDIRQLHPARQSGMAAVGIDALALPPQFSGAANYIYNLIVHLLREPREFPIAIFCRREHRRLFDSFLSPGDKLIPIDVRSQLSKLLFYEFALARRCREEGVRLFYATHYLCPPQSEQMAIINTFHDMGFINHPQFYPWHKRLYFGRRMKAFFRRSDAVVAVSQTTASQIHQAFPEHDKPVRVVPPGVDHKRTLETQSATIRIEPPFILAVNTWEIRKNIPFIIRVFNQLKSRFRIPHKLVIAGQPGNAQKLVTAARAKSRFRDQIILTQFVPESDLRQLYQQCDLFVNASSYEGFGFTPFEAIRSGCPAFLYGNAAVHEFLGHHPYIFDHFDISRWAEAIWLASREGFPERIATARIEHLTWKAHAEAIHALIKSQLYREGVAVAC